MLAQKIKQKLIDEKSLKDENQLEFIEGNISQFNLCAGTVFFMCSTCFSDELMKELTHKLERIPHPIKIVTLRALPLDATSDIKLLDTLSLPMSWSDGSSVYIYEKK